MGFFDNIGSTILDVTQGMEYTKTNQRRDAEFERNQKRADMQDKVAGYGLEDLERTRADAAGTRDAFKTGGLSAVQAAAQARGDVSGAITARDQQLKALRDDYETEQIKFERELMPKAMKLKGMQTDTQLRRQPGMDTLGDMQLQEALGQSQEKLIARAWQIANLDKDTAVKLLSDSNVIFQGKKVTDILRSKDGQRVALIGEDGQPMTMLNTQYLDSLASKYGDPGKVIEVEKDKRLVHVTPGGKAREIYAAPDKEVPGRFTLGPNGEVLNTRTGTVTPGTTGGKDPKRQDARVQMARDHINKALGGSLNMGLSEPDAQKVYEKAAALAETYIAKGDDPIAAANKAMDEVRRTVKLAGLSSSGGPAAPATKFDWKALLQSQ